MTRGAWYTKIGRNDVDAGKPDEVLKVESDAARDQAIIDAGFHIWTWIYQIDQNSKYPYKKMILYFLQI